MKTPDRIEVIRTVVDSIIFDREAQKRCRDCFVHLYGVALAAGILARKRGLDEELAIIAGMLHDISTCKSGTHEDHHQRSATLAEQILESESIFSDTEIRHICSAIRNHGRKVEVDNDFDELLKDADVLQHHHYNPFLLGIARENDRLDSLRTELSFPSRGDRRKCH